VSSVIEHIGRVVGRISTTLALLGATILGLLAMLVIVDIVGRQIGHPVRGTVELAAMTVAAATFLTIPYAMRQRGHVRSTIIVQRLPDSLGRWFEALAFAIGAATFAVLAVSSYEPMMSAFAHWSYEGEGSLRVPTFPTRTIIFVGSVVMTAECVLASIGALVLTDSIPFCAEPLLPYISL
jgi:TRAP-type C4-dicarboxylate transport system permease small subunit